MDNNGGIKHNFPDNDPRRYETIPSRPRLGQGTTSNVYEAMDKNTDQRVAVKIVNEASSKSAKIEVECLRMCSHPNIVELLAFFVDNSKFWIVMPKMDDNLMGYINDNYEHTTMPIADIKSVAFRVARAISHLRQRGIVHCDIKPDNILVSDGSKVVKLADFGVAERMKDGRTHVQRVAYSPAFRAPEVAIGPRFDYPADVWAFGMVILRLITGKSIFKVSQPSSSSTASIDEQINTELLTSIIAFLESRPSNEIVKAIGAPPEKFSRLMPKNHQKSFRWITASIDENGQQLLANILQYDPSARPKPVDILLSPWFDEVRDKPECALQKGEVPAEKKQEEEKEEEEEVKEEEDDDE